MVFPVYLKNPLQNHTFKQYTESSRSTGYMVGMITECNETIFFCLQKKVESNLYISNMDELAY